MRTSVTAAPPVEWVTAVQAAVMLGLSREVIERWRGAGYLGTRFVGREVEILMSSIVARANKGSLTALRPELAMHWHPELNGAMSPNDVDPDHARAVWWTCASEPPHRWKCRVRARSKDGTGCPTCRRYPDELLRDRYPELTREFHPTKNPAVRRGEIRTRHARPVWWRCAKNPEHIWRATVAARINTPCCPVCAGQIPIPKLSLSASHPDLAREWDPERNGARGPDDVCASSPKLVWWRCSANSSHVWEAKVYSRTRYGARCPSCSAPSGTHSSSFGALFPDIAREWHQSRNGVLGPYDLGPKSQRKVWWKCRLRASHTWQATVSERVAGKGCPRCRTIPVTRVSALIVRFPEVAREWHPTKNGWLGPGRIASSSSVPVWWRCSKDPCHEWRATPRQRTEFGAGCPLCDGQ